MRRRGITPKLSDTLNAAEWLLEHLRPADSFYGPTLPPFKTGAAEIRKAIKELKKTGEEFGGCTDQDISDILYVADRLAVFQTAAFYRSTMHEVDFARSLITALDKFQQREGESRERTKRKAVMDQHFRPLLTVVRTKQ